jgi:hypothetical protein
MDETMKILVRFDNDDHVTWHSTGWGNDRSAIDKAQKAIGSADTPDEVIEFLTDAGFEVVELPAGVDPYRYS